MVAFTGITSYAVLIESASCCGSSFLYGFPPRFGGWNTGTVNPAFKPGIYNGQGQWILSIAADDRALYKAHLENLIRQRSMTHAFINNEQFNHMDPLLRELRFTRVALTTNENMKHNTTIHLYVYLKNPDQGLVSEGIPLTRCDSQHYMAGRDYDEGEYID